MKVSLQTKIAELERRIITLEERDQRRILRAAKTGTVMATATKNGQTVEVEQPLVEEVFASFDRVMKRIFG